MTEIVSAVFETSSRAEAAMNDLKTARIPICRCAAWGRWLGSTRRQQCNLAPERDQLAAAIGDGCGG
jgi:hypothetical protein